MGVADDHLGATAAHIQTEQRALANVDRAQHAEVDEARLLAAGHDVHVESGLVTQARQERRPVARLAGRRRGHGHYLRRPARACQLGEGAADGDRSLDGGRSQQAVPELLLAEAHHLALQVDDAVGQARADQDDHQPHRVGADVDERDDVTEARVAVRCPEAQPYRHPIPSSGVGGIPARRSRLDVD